VVETALRPRRKSNGANMKQPIRPNIQIQSLGTPDQGKQLELVVVDENGNPKNDICYPLAAVLADAADESLWFEIYTEQGPIQIPLSTIQHAIEKALTEVHSETWYEKNVYSLLKNTKGKEST